MDPTQLAKELERLAKLKFDGWNESDVREDFIAPLLGLLGYRRDTDYDVNREGQHLLQRPYGRVGRTKIRIDYKLVVRKLCFWLIEAKGPAVEIPVEDVDQAFQYAMHPEVRARYFVVCNGKQTDVYDTRNPDSPLLLIKARDLPSRFPELNALLGAQAIVNHLHEQLAGDLRAVLAVEIREDRAQQLRAKLNNIFGEMKETIRQNKVAVFREKWEVIDADWRDLVDSAKGSLQIASDVLLPELSLNEFSVAESAMKRWLAAEDEGVRTQTVSKLIGLLGQPISSVRRFNVLRMLVRLRRNPDVVSRRADIDAAVVLAIKSAISNFGDAPPLRLVEELEGALFRVLYKSTFCEPGMQRDLESIVRQKLAVISDEERIHSEPTVDTERVRIAHAIAVNAFLSLSRLSLATTQQEIANLIAVEERFRSEFDKAVEGKRNGLHLYASYGQPFDFMRSQLFHVLASEFEDVVDLVDEDTIQQTCRLVSRLDAAETYALVHAEDFLTRILWYRECVRWSCERPAEIFPKTLRGVFVHRMTRPPVQDVRIWGPVAGGYMEVFAKLDLDEQLLDVGTARPME